MTGIGYWQSGSTLQAALSLSVAGASQPRHRYVTEVGDDRVQEFSAARGFITAFRSVDSGSWAP